MSDKDNGDVFAESRPERKNLSVKKLSAGAGIVGLLGFVALSFIAGLFFITENYFICMFIMSLALMVYVTGHDIVKIMVSSFTVFFSSKHLIEKAVCLQENLEPLGRILKIRQTPGGDLEAGPLEDEAVISLPNNNLSRDISGLLEDEKDVEYAEYIAHSYYVECHELYEFTHANLDFTANAMPLFGLIGTIIGLIAMFDTLGANVTVETLAPQLALALKTTLYGAIFSTLYKIIGSRFEQRLKTLEYDYDTFCYGLEVLFKNKCKVEVSA